MVACLAAIIKEESSPSLSIAAPILLLRQFGEGGQGPEKAEDAEFKELMVKDELGTRAGDASS